MRPKISPTIILAFIILILAESSCLVQANPYWDLGTVPPDTRTKPPPITVFSPTNGTIYYKTPIELEINVSLPQSPTAMGTILYRVYYQGDWQNNETNLYINMGYDNTIESQREGPEHQFFTGKFNLTNVPDGNHSITITALAGGFYEAHNTDYPSFYRFLINGSTTIFFETNSHFTITTPTTVIQEPNGTYIAVLIIAIFIPIALVGLILRKRA